jgi:hypothetical protein
LGGTVRLKAQTNAGALLEVLGPARVPQNP